jgi:phenylpropionate dioxygenase-like ring-hydroxylating dioxygenase large terminal subunit
MVDAYARETAGGDIDLSERMEEEGRSIDPIGRAIAAHRPGHALSQPFYCDPTFFQCELQRLLKRHWHCVGHLSQAPDPGDFFTVDIFEESLIIVCGHDRRLRALLNVCRHRGSRLCTERSGHARAGGFVCPYHAWSYNLDGTLRSARYLSPDFDRTKYGLKSVHLRVVEGLIFVCLAEVPLGLEDVATVLARSAGVYGWGDAKVAHRESYPVRANWKLVEENYMECYHCAPAHVEYSRFHLYARPEELNRQADALLRERTRALGLEILDVDHWGEQALPGQEAVDSLRSALSDGTVSGSEDGRPLAPLMGQFQRFDGGVTFFDVGLTSHFLAYPDHGLIYRFVPQTVERTDMEVIWLVRGDAVAGVDYDVGRLTWLWRVTSEADKRIIELNQQGVNSRWYEPGPYSQMEQHAARFVQWILAGLSVGM